MGPPCKLAPTLLAGVPAIVKPATSTSYVTELAVRLMLESGILPEGTVQLVAGGLGDMLDHLECQDTVSFTGSAMTALKLRSHPTILSNSVRFAAEQDSLNASILGPDALPGTPEFDLFIKEVDREMTTKAGQKCTAIRRIIVPQSQEEAVVDALKTKLAKLKRELIEPSGRGKGGGKAEGFDVKATGDARVGLIGFPSVGKSTLMTKLTGTFSRAADFEFTTVTCIPGVFNYRGTKI